jgi:hypothetical protein
MLWMSASSAPVSAVDVDRSQDVRAYSTQTQSHAMILSKRSETML